MASQHLFQNKRLMIGGGIFLALAVIGAAGYLGYKTSNSQAAAPPPAPPTVSATMGDVVLSVTATGTSVYTHQTQIGSQVNANVDEILVQPGDPV
ncbi:MAG TPA: hypothetical protein VN203_01120, partial [Candidatus Acidoferrum sp.]|nr:hypothetical protein [Candidatus Acidoferrum sp.]